MGISIPKAIACVACSVMACADLCEDILDAMLLRRLMSAIEIEGTSSLCSVAFYASMSNVV